MPDFSADSKALRWLCSLAERKPRAVVVLLLSAVGRKSNREIARLTGLSLGKVGETRTWLRSHNPTAASMCTTR